MGWEHESRIPDLSQTSSTQIAALAWVPGSERELVIAYKSHGVRYDSLRTITRLISEMQSFSIWDTSTLTVLRIFNHHDVMYI